MRNALSKQRSLCIFCIQVDGIMIAADQCKEEDTIFPGVTSS
jgi:hypothetical protein